MKPWFNPPREKSRSDFIFALYFLSFSQLRNPTIVSPGPGKLLMIKWNVAEKVNSKPGLGIGSNSGISQSS